MSNRKCEAQNFQLKHFLRLVVLTLVFKLSFFLLTMQQKSNEYHSEYSRHFLYLLSFYDRSFFQRQVSNKKSQTTKNQYLTSIFHVKQILVIQNVTYEIFFTNNMAKVQLQGTFILLQKFNYFFRIYKLHGHVT